MDLHAELLEGHSEEQTAKISKWVGNDAKRFAELIRFSLYGEHRASLRAGWVVNIIIEQYPQLVKPHLSELVSHIAQKDVSGAIKRNVVRLLQFIEIPKKLHGDVINVCFDFLLNPKEAIAIRVFSMTVLHNLSKNYPEIKQELKAVLENALEHEDASAGYKNRALKILKAIK
jgi:hypothetical protein